MRIGEIAELTGLSISNIRFYEKKGLIGPDREADNKYRNYTDEDLEKLKLIILYRKMDISVETIGQIFDSKLSAHDVFAAQIDELEKKKEALQSSIDLCKKASADNSESIDVDYLLNYVKEEEARGIIFEKIDDLLEDFSGITSMNRMYFSRGIFPRYWMYQVVKILWCLFMGLLPVITIICALVDENGINIAIVVMMGMILVAYISSIIVYFNAKR